MSSIVRAMSIHLEGLQVSCGTLGMPTATVRLRGPIGVIHNFASMGTGPVDATYKAIDAIVKTPCKLLEFNIHAITEGIDALGEVTVRIQSENDGQQTMDAQSEACMPASSAVTAQIPTSSSPAPRPISMPSIN